VLTTMKTKKCVTIPMAQTLVEHLKRFKKPSVIAEMPVLPKAFKALQGAHGRVTTLSNRFADLLAECDLRPKKPHHIIVAGGRDGRKCRHALSFHCLRHTAVSFLKNAGVPQSVAMEFVGHDSPEISQHYTHVGEEALRKACAALPTLEWPPSAPPDGPPLVPLIPLAGCSVMPKQFLELL
jgi:integrase